MEELASALAEVSGSGAGGSFLAAGGGPTRVVGTEALGGNLSPSPSAQEGHRKSQHVPASPAEALRETEAQALWEEWQPWRR